MTQSSVNQFETPELRRYRLNRVREQLRAHGYAGVVLFDPLNIRYATGSRNLAVWTLHNPGRYAYVATDGPVILFEFSGAFHLNEHLETVDEQRPAVPWFFFLAGPRVEEKARQWASEIAALVRETGNGNTRLAVDRIDAPGHRHLGHLGIEVVEGQPLLELARAIKSPEEIDLLKRSMAVAHEGVSRIEAAIRPGVTENYLWSLLHQTNIEAGGEWIETRLLSSGERTNPWYQESSDRVIQAGDLIGIDTDLIGPSGYLADFSRTFHCGPVAPTKEQKRLYQTAVEQVEHNRGLLRAGLSFREFSQQCWRMPEEFVAQRYMDLVHGVGLCDEYPRIPYQEDFADWGYDGVFEENMVVSVESYIGRVGGADGVKFEQQVRITADGTELLSHYPLEQRLLD
jgi:Xaa-Pro aminopeptidase